METEQWAPGFATAIAVCVFYAILIAWVCRFAIRLLSRYGGGTASSGFTKLVAFAIAALLVPSGFFSIFRIATSLARLLFIDIVTLAERLFRYAPDYKTWKESASALTLPLFLSSRDLGSTLYDAVVLSGEQTLDIIFLFTVWLISGVFIQAAIGPGAVPGLGAMFKRARLIVLGMTPATRKNAYAALLMAIAAWLSFTALVAIPSMTQTASRAQRTADELEKKLSEIADINKDIDQLLPNAGTLKLPDALSKEINETSQSASKQLKEDWKYIVAEIDRALQQNQMLQDIRDRAALTLNRTHNHAKKIAVEAFREQSAERVGQRETGTHYFRLLAWFQNGLLMEEAKLKACGISLQNQERFQENFAKRWLTEVKNRLGVKAAPTSAPLSEIADPSVYTPVTTRSSFAITRDEDPLATNEELRRVCLPEDAGVGMPPPREPLGTSLGVFGAAASFLLRTESLPLTMIVGLLGFGLLGAACASFVRQTGRRRPADPWIDDLVGVVVRGTTAAIVVFLAFYGGLALFLSEEPRPNPYVVLFTCLVGAVFSEDVWTWARTRLSAGLAAQRREGAPTELPSRGNVDNPDAPVP